MSDREITEQDMYFDYSLWLAQSGYIEDCSRAQEEYRQWKSESGFID